MFRKTPSSKPCAKASFLQTATCLFFLFALFSGVAQAQSWDDLNPESQTVLRPLRGTWEQMPTQQRQEWLEHVPQLQNMSPEERSNAQERMAEWAVLSTKQRNQVQEQLVNDANNNANTRNRSWTRYLNFR